MGSEDAVQGRAPGGDRAAWPRVTEVIRAAGLIDAAHFTQYDLDRGTATHEAARLLLDGTLDRDTVDPAVAGRLAQFERFLAECRPAVEAVELEVSHAGLRYKGRLDLLATISGQRAVIDIKGPSRAPWHGVQTAAYQHAAPGGIVSARYTLHLWETDYRLVQHTDHNDWPRFVAALKEYRHAHADHHPVA